MPTEEQLRSFRSRDLTSPRGKYYVDDQCTDCDLCRETAPMVFTRNDYEGMSYVLRQPITAEEIEQVEESVEGCCMGAIKTDGLEFDWEKNVPLDSGSLIRGEESRGDLDGGRKRAASGKPCCRRNTRPWWKFW